MTEDTQVVEKRIKSTIIRRRKSAVPDEALVKTDLGAEVPLSPAVATAQQAAELPQKVSTDKSSAPVTSQKTEVAQPATPGTVKLVPKTTPLVPLLVPDEEEEGKKPKLKKVIKKRENELEVDLEGVGRISSMTQLTRIVHVDRVDRVFQPDRSSKRKKVTTKKAFKKPAITVTKPIKRIVEMHQKITVGDLAHAMGIKANALIAKLIALGTMATINQELDFDTAQVLAHDFQFEVKDVTFKEASVLEETPSESQKLKSRPPVVTVMGHVDHGKTSLLDAIRATSVAKGEAGGITQHIGAYTVTLPKGKITFLDTPGHEAFTAMRARGAAVTDIVILVVAADDGIMPQTIESIDHAKAAGVPIVVAVNKIDRPEANVDRVKRQLAEHSLSPEEWGGETLYSLVSAKQNQGIDDLLEKILLQAEVLELKADPSVRAKGTVVESRLDRFRGPVATVLVQQGTLRKGDVIVAGSHWGHVRAMTNHQGVTVEEAPPSFAVEILGLDGVPQASDLFNAVSDEQAAKLIVDHRLELKRQLKAGSTSKVSLEDVFAKIQMGDVKELNVVLKTDVHGSLEAVSEALKKLSTDKVQLKVIHSGVGGVSESDVLLASASKAVVIGFNVRPETNAIKVAHAEGVEIKLYKIIYDMVNDVKLAMRGLLAPTKKEKYLGRADVRQAFTVSKIGTIAGCIVSDGKVTRGSQLRLLRDNVVLYEGKVASLKRSKDDAREVTQGMECGIAIEGYQDIKTGDVIEVFEIELIQAEL